MDILFDSNGLVTVLMGTKEVALNMSKEAEIKKKEAAAAAAGDSSQASSAPEADLTIIKDASGEAPAETATDTAVVDQAATGETAPADTAADTAAVDEAATTETATDTGAVGDVAVDSEVIGSEEPVDGVITDDATATDIAVGGSFDQGYNGGKDMGEGMMVDPGMPKVKDPLLSNWFFVIGISAAVLIVSVALGVLLAKLKIKKGIDLYED